LAEGLASNFCETEQRFLLLFLEKDTSRLVGFLGASPQTPVVPLRGRFGFPFSAKQNNAFCFFFWKKKETSRPVGFLGASPQTPVVPLRGRLGWGTCEAEERFLFYERTKTARVFVFKSPGGESGKDGRF
jgi:hypothetical protein